VSANGFVVVVLMIPLCLVWDSVGVDESNTVDCLTPEQRRKRKKRTPNEKHLI